jgi:hypothetical protein
MLTGFGNEATFGDGLPRACKRAQELSGPLQSHDAGNPLQPENRRQKEKIKRKPKRGFRPLTVQAENKKTGFETKPVP